jgi:hypothetical protein
VFYRFIVFFISSIDYRLVIDCFYRMSGVMTIETTCSVYQTVQCLLFTTGHYIRHKQQQQHTTQQKQKQQHDRTLQPVANPQSGSDNPLSARDRVHLKSRLIGMPSRSVGVCCLSHFLIAPSVNFSRVPLNYLPCRTNYHGFVATHMNRPTIIVNKEPIVGRESPERHRAKTFSSLSAPDGSLRLPSVLPFFRLVILPVFTEYLNLTLAFLHHPLIIVTSHHAF